VYHWRTEANGAVSVDTDGKGFAAFYPSLDPATTAKLDSVRSRFGSMAQTAAAAGGVPPSWLLAVAYSEGGDPSARGADGEIGLCQIMPGTGAELGYSAAMLTDPAQNLRCAATLLGRSRAKGFDLPAAASRYNAGGDATTGAPHPSPSSPWGYRATGDYISRVVGASNYYLGVSDAGGAPDLGFALLVGLGVLGWQLTKRGK
jgi:soluble lytic murein transglycosylase-like protein